MFLHAAFASAFLIFATPSIGVMAQGLDAEGAIDAIVGSDVKTGEEAAADDEARIIAAIERSSENTSEVRKRFNIDRVDIVFLPDLGDQQTAVEAKMEEFRDEIAALQTEIQGSALFYHAVDSHSVLLGDIVAMEFDDNNGATIFVAGREPGNRE